METFKKRVCMSSTSTITITEGQPQTNELRNRNQVNQGESTYRGRTYQSRSSGTASDRRTLTIASGALTGMTVGAIGGAFAGGPGGAVVGALVFGCIGLIAGCGAQNSCSE